MVRELDHGAQVDDPLQRVVLDRLGRAIDAILGASCISISLLDPTSGDLVTDMDWLADPRMARPGHRRLHEGIEGWTAAGLSPISIEDIVTSNHSLAGDAPPGIRSLLCLPLAHEQHLLGTVLIASDEPYAFTDGRLVVIQACVDQTASALAATSLAQSGQASLRAAEHLLDAALALGSTLDQAQLPSYITASIRRAIACEDAFIYAYDAPAGVLRLIAGMGESAERALGLKVAVKDPLSLAAWVVREAHGRLTMPGQDETEELMELALGPSTKALLAVPLVVRNQLRGVAVLARTRAFSSAEFQTTYRLGALIAAALENVEHFREALAHQEQLAAIFTAASDGIALVESDMKVIEANDAFAGCVGLVPSDVLGADVCGLFKQYAPGMCSLCEGSCLIKQVLETGESVAHVECELVVAERGQKQGTRISGGWVPLRYMDFSVTPLDGPHGRRVLLQGRDVTATRAIEQTKAHFFSMVSHELRTPLQTINGYLDLTLAGMAGDLSSEQADFLRRARASSEHMALLVDDLLLISRSDSGKFALHRDETYLVALIHEVVEELELFAEDAGVHLRADVPASLPLVHVDAQRITQVLRNLVTNAVKFTPADGEVTISAGALGDQVVLRVQDTGIGIAPEHQEHIFDRFFQVAGVTSTARFQGQGLGLAIVKIIVEGHGGSVLVDSLPGRGSTFTVQLPRTWPEEL
jgi:signal transduction histidine kinase/GAF domain-containing protein